MYVQLMFYALNKHALKSLCPSFGPYLVLNLVNNAWISKETGRIVPNIETGCRGHNPYSYLKVKGTLWSSYITCYM